MKLHRENAMKLALPPSPGRAYTADEKARVLAEAAKLRNTNMYPALVVDLNCGLRDKELRNSGGAMYNRCSQSDLLMRFISSLDQHPESRKARFPEHLWPRGSNPKDVDEGWIAVEFTNSAGLHLERAPTKLLYPMPDLECVVDGKPMLLELGEILNSNLAEGIVYSGKQADKKVESNANGNSVAANSIQTAVSCSFDANGSLLRILAKKLAKTYETSGLRTHLLLFYDLERPWGPFDYLLQRPDVFAGLIADSVFERVWIFDLQSATVIGYLEAVADGALRAFFDWQFHVDLFAPIGTMNS